MAGFKISRVNETARVVVGAKLTAVEVSQLQQELKSQLSSGAREMVFDLEGTVALDSVGIGLLIAASNSLAAIQGSLQVVNVPAEILKLFQGMRLVDRLHATPAGK